MSIVYSDENTALYLQIISNPTRYPENVLKGVRLVQWYSTFTIISSTHSTIVYNEWGHPRSTSMERELRYMKCYIKKNRMIETYFPMQPIDASIIQKSTGVLLDICKIVSQYVYAINITPLQKHSTRKLTHNLQQTKQDIKAFLRSKKRRKVWDNANRMIENLPQGFRSLRSRNIH